MSNINSIISSFKQQKDLNSKIWYKSKDQEYKMNPKVRVKLLEIAHEFISFLDVDALENIDGLSLVPNLYSFNSSLDFKTLFPLHNICSKKCAVPLGTPTCLSK